MEGEASVPYLVVGVCDEQGRLYDSGKPVQSSDLPSIFNSLRSREKPEDIFKSCFHAQLRRRFYPDEATVHYGAFSPLSQYGLDLFARSLPFTKPVYIELPRLLRFKPEYEAHVSPFRAFVLFTPDKQRNTIVKAAKSNKKVGTKAMGIRLTGKKESNLWVVAGNREPVVRLHPALPASREPEGDASIAGKTGAAEPNHFDTFDDFACALVDTREQFVLPTLDNTKYFVNVAESTQPADECFYVHQPYNGVKGKSFGEQFDAECFPYDTFANTLPNIPAMLKRHAVHCVYVGKDDDDQSFQEAPSVLERRRDSHESCSSGSWSTASLASMSDSSVAAVLKRLASACADSGENDHFSQEALPKRRRYSQESCSAGCLSGAPPAPVSDSKVAAFPRRHSVASGSTYSAEDDDDQVFQEAPSQRRKYCHDSWSLPKPAPVSNAKVASFPRRHGVPCGDNEEGDNNQSLGEAPSERHRCSHESSPTRSLSTALPAPVSESRVTIQMNSEGVRMDLDMNCPKAAQFGEYVVYVTQAAKHCPDRLPPCPNREVIGSSQNPVLAIAID